MELSTFEKLNILENRIEDYLSQACILSHEWYGFDLESCREDMALIKKVFHKSLIEYEAKRKGTNRYLSEARFPSKVRLRKIIARYRLPRLSRMEAQSE